MLLNSKGKAVPYKKKYSVDELSTYTENLTPRHYKEAPKGFFALGTRARLKG